VLVDSDGPRVSVIELENVIVVVDGDDIMITTVAGMQKVGKLAGTVNQYALTESRLCLTSKFPNGRAWQCTADWSSQGRFLRYHGVRFMNLLIIGFLAGS